MLKREKDYAKVESYRKKHPDVTVRMALEATKVNPSSYYIAARAKLPVKKKPTYQKIRAVAPPAEMPRMGVRCFVIQGTPDEVRETLRGLQ